MDWEHLSWQEGGPSMDGWWKHSMRGCRGGASRVLAALERTLGELVALGWFL